jgi:hypothetical protein
MAAKTRSVAICIKVSTFAERRYHKAVVVVVVVIIIIIIIIIFIKLLCKA